MADIEELQEQVKEKEIQKIFEFDKVSTVCQILF